MSDTKFTPGPWWAVGDSVYWSSKEPERFGRASASFPGGMIHIAEIQTDDIEEKYDGDPDSAEYLIEQEIEANTHLIAAAPEMYDALQYCCNEAMLESDMKTCGQPIPRCFGHREIDPENNLHCAAAEAGGCKIWNAIKKARGEA